jgi:predicted O-methyltransferase YrrM
MHRYALEQAPAFVDALDLSGVASVLDLGGGSGAYALTFAERLPDADVTLFDRDEVIQIARENIRRAGYAHRIVTRVGDILSDDFGSGYDLIWVSNVVHGWGENDVRTGLRRIHDALAPGGRLILRDFIMSPDKTEPAFGAVFALNMLVSTPRGNSYSTDEYAAWLDEAGFAAHRRIEVSGAGSTAMIEARAANPRRTGA